MRRLFAFLSLGLSLCAGAQAPTAPSSDVPSETLAQLDQLHKVRDTPERMKEQADLLAKLLPSHPRSYELLWRAARWETWQADGLPKGPEKARVARVGWDLAERAAALQPERPEGHYYAALGIGAYSLAVGVMKAIGEGLEGKFHKHLDASIKASLEFERRGALVMRARAYYEVPWPKRDLEKSEIILTQVVQKHPQNLRAWLYLAETQLRRDHPRQAQESIAKVINGSVDYDSPEGRRDKGWASWVQAQIQKELP
jgi:hypothetical protein